MDIGEILSTLGDALFGDGGFEFDIAGIYTFLVRFALPILALVILVRCFRSLLAEKPDRETWAHVTLPNGSRIPVHHWENVIGRAKSSDIVINYPTISRNHASLIRSDDGVWYISDLNSSRGLSINRKELQPGERAALSPNDIISFGDVEAMVIPVTAEEHETHARLRVNPAEHIHPISAMLLLTLFQLLTTLQMLMTTGEEFRSIVMTCMGGLIGVMWIYYLVVRFLKRSGFEVEIIAFFLCTLGMAVVCSSVPQELVKQGIAILIGIFVFIGIAWILRDLERAKKLRWYAAGAAILLLIINLIFGTKVYGARNWIMIGSLSVQPSEIVKILFIFVGTATLDRLFARRNLIMFIGFTAICIGALALMGDFGTASIFFAAFIIIAFMRSGDIAIISLTCSGAVFAGALAMYFRPYIAERFASWGHAWEFADAGGFQQVRAMSAAASGGLLGVGAGNGWLTNVVAADTDLVFGVLCEEWGLIIAVFAVLSIAVLSLFTVRAAHAGRSPFYVIAACAAMSLLVFQTFLNVLGSVDLLPLTGVPFPFVANGGSSMIASWGLLAFVKAADTRQNASWAIRLGSRRDDDYDEEDSQ